MYLYVRMTIGSARLARGWLFQFKIRRISLSHRHDWRLVNDTPCACDSEPRLVQSARVRAGPTEAMSSLDRVKPPQMSYGMVYEIYTHNTSIASKPHYDMILVQSQLQIEMASINLWPEV